VLNDILNKPASNEPPPPVQPAAPPPPAAPAAPLPPAAPAAPLPPVFAQPVHPDAGVDDQVRAFERSQAMRHIYIGGFLLALGIGLTAAMDNVIWYGAILVGGADLIRGFMKL
jgi:uncharacterized membrane protein